MNHQQRERDDMFAKQLIKGIWCVHVGKKRYLKRARNGFDAIIKATGGKV